MYYKKNRNWILKYVFEWILAFILIIITSPVFILIIVLQQLLDPGKILYISERNGKGGSTFKLYKFRSMKMGSKEIRSIDNKLITTDNDPRITFFGSLLRLGFDELPQLFNVIKGDMCIIGPRPDLPEEFFNYSETEIIRVSVLPGITGLSQVLNGRSLPKKINYELDVRYILYSSMFTDIKILLLTIPFSFGMKKIGRNYLKSFIHDINFI